jgi:putative transposase
MGISRQAYYKRNRAFDARVCQDQQVVEFVLEKRRRQPRLGTRKLHHLMVTEAAAALRVGRDRLFSILREARELVPRIAIIASAVTPTYSKPARNKL